MENNDAEKLTPEQKEFVKGFNQGYILEKHSPEMLKQILADQGNSKLPLIEGIKSGAKERQKENFMSLFNNKDKSKDKGHSW